MKLDINKIKENPENPRKIDKDKFAKLVKSLKDFPEMLDVRRLVIDENNVVLGGNMRLKALKQAGIKEIPVIQAKNWTEEQKKEFIIKDNISFGSWDWDMLSSQYEMGELTDWGIDFDSFNETPDNLDFEEELVLEVLPPEAPELKERIQIKFDDKDLYDDIKSAMSEYSKEEIINKFINMFIESGK